MPLNENETTALIAHAKAGGPEGENAERLLSQLTPYSPFMQRAMALIEEAKDIDGLRAVSGYADTLKTAIKARGMGVDAENVAGEVVIRADRAIGQALRRMEAQGMLAGKGVKGNGTDLLHLSDVLEVPGPKAKTQAAEYRTIADIPESEFEERILDAKSKGQRLARYKFHGRGATSIKERIAKALAGDGGDIRFTRLRDATWGILGREVDEVTGEARFTRNAFMDMHVDDLRESAALITALVTAYQEARRER